MPYRRRLAGAIARVLAVALLMLPPGFAAAQSATYQSSCSSDIGAGPLYVSPVFNTGFNVKSRMAMGMIEREFDQYLRGRFGLVNNTPYRIVCTRMPTGAEAAHFRDSLSTAAKGAGRPVMAVEWSYRPDPAQVALSFDLSQQEQGRNAEVRGPLDHGYCFSNGIGGPQYVSAVFLSGPGANLSQWLQGFDRFLRAKYGFTGNGTDPRVVNPVDCNLGWTVDAERMVRARGEGARAGGRNVIETGWKPGDAAPATAASAAQKPAADREPPAAKAPPAPPSAEVKRLATEEGPAVLALCQNDRLVDGAFDCYAVQRAIYTWRVEHAAAPREPLNDLFWGEKIDQSSALKTNYLSMWAANRAMSNGYSSPKSQCVGTKFEASIRQHPFPHRVKDLFEAAMQACPK